MVRAVFMCMCVLLAVAPQAARAQSYQQYSDGLVSVTTKKVVDPQGVAFDVCALLVRHERVGALHVRLNLWKPSGGFAGQLSSVLHPGIAISVCRRIRVPPESADFGRWEVARFRFLREQTPQRAGHLDHAS